MNSEKTRLGLDQMTARIRELEGAPISRITAAARREAESINLSLPESTLKAWAYSVHDGQDFTFAMR
jgi:hypothetical protein